MSVTVQELFKAEEYVEDATKQGLIAAGVDHIFTQRDNDPVSTAYRVAVQCRLTTSTARKTIDNHGNHWVAEWNGTLTFFVFTKRSKESDKFSGHHATIKGAIRAMLGKQDANNVCMTYTTDIAPYHYVMKALPQDTNPSVEMQPQTDEDVSAIAYTIIAGIRKTAFP